MQPTIAKANPSGFSFLKTCFFLFCLIIPCTFYAQHRNVDTASYSRMPEIDLKESSAFSGPEIFKLSVKNEDIQEFLGLVDLFEEVRELHIVVDKSEIKLVDLLTAIGHLRSLNKLTLVVNESGPMPAEIGSLTDLLSLTISGKRITSLPPEIGNLTNLEILSLEDLKITTFPTEVGKLKNLKVLDIHGLNTLDLTPFTACANIEEIRLRNNNLSKLPETILHFKNLSHLCVDGSPGLDFNQTFTDLASLPNLGILQLKNDKLKSLPASISKIKGLVSVDLTSNEFVAFPSELLGLTSLLQLSLRNNSLSSLPTELSKLQYLSALNLSGNKFTTIPGVLTTLSRLTTLNMDNNPISDLGSDLPKMQQLTTLSLLDTKKLDPASAFEALSVLTNLTDLSMSGNSVSSLPSNISKLKNIKSLELNYGLKTMPNEICEMSTLEELYLNDNRLDGLPENIKNLQNLSILDLSGNLFRTFPKMLIRLPKLQELTIADNQIASIVDYGQGSGSAIISGFRELKYMDLSGNEKLTSDDIVNLIGDLPVFQVCISDTHMEYRSEAERAFKLGSDRENQKDYSGALEQFNKAIKMDPQLGEAFAERGRIKFLLTGDFPGAMKDITSAIAMDSNRAQFWRTRADIKNSMGDYNSAEADYTTAIKLNRNDEASFASRGSIRFSKFHDNKSSIDDYTAAIAINPNPVYYVARAKVRMDQGEKNAACDDLRKASEQGDKKAAEDLKVYCK